MPSAIPDPSSDFIAIVRAHRVQLAARLGAVDALITLWDETAWPAAIVAELASEGIERIARDEQAITALPPAPFIAPKPVPQAAEPASNATWPTGPATGNFPALTQKTPERVELLKTLCAIVPAVSDREIVRRLNELPGAMVNPGNIAAYKVQWGARAAFSAAPSKPVVTPPPAAREVTTAMSQSFRPEVVTQAYAISWGAQRGIPGPKLDLAAINAKRRQHQLAPFVIEGRD